MRATAIALFTEMIRGAASSMVTASYFDIPVIGYASLEYHLICIY